jgi:hypothetical protein
MKSMSPRLIARLIATSITAAAATTAAAQTPSDAAPAGDSARALERCEAAVVDTLRKLRGKQAQEVQFTPAQRAVNPGDEGEISVKGAGRYRSGLGSSAGAGASFSFSCSFSAKTGLASGVVLREAGANAARAPADWQPDLSRVSPDACESAAAQLLKEKHPRVAQIAMEPDTRRLQPGPDDHILLLGQGALRPAAGMNAVPFSYSCEIDGRTGRLVAVKTSV